MTTWRIDIVAKNRADAIRQLNTSWEPCMALDHFVRLVSGEDYTRVGIRNPDTPFHLVGSGEDLGNGMISLAEARIVYRDGR